MNFDFIESGTLNPGTNFITRSAPGIGANGGGAIEVVAPSGWCYTKPLFDAMTDERAKESKMIILSNQQLYAAVRSTATLLEEKNLESEAKKLKAALSISTMPGEILGEIRLVLQDIKSRPRPPELDFEIDSEITYINSVLR